MKILAALILTLTALSAQAGRHHYYIHNTTHERIDIMKIDPETQMGKYYDHASYKYKTVSMTELTRQTHGNIKGFKAGNMVLANLEGNVYQPCEMWYLFENSVAHIGCQSGKITKNIGVDRPQVLTYALHLDHMINEVASLEGYAKKDKVRLMKDAGDLKKGDLVRIEHIFANGFVMIQKMGANLLDTSGLLMKSRVQVVELKDLSTNI